MRKEGVSASERLEPTLPPMASSGYALLDFGSGKRLERWGDFTLIRPDPTATGAPLHPEYWNDADAVYEGEKGKGKWVTSTPLPDRWPVAFDDLTLLAGLTPYKHTGIFPEQQANWSWMRACRRIGRPLSVLNLFAYSGGATVALAKDGHHVTHVDASRPSIAWAKENAAANDIPDDRIRWMLEGAPLFAEREAKRGHRYDGILLDPPAYGHAPDGGKAWRAERDLAGLLQTCVSLLSDTPAFLLLNGYARGDTPDCFHRLLFAIFKTHAPHLHFRLETADLSLASADGRRLSTGVVARCLFAA
jgi:23S rRNA (cytosine1962-C5)-methyltransferase